VKTGWVVCKTRVVAPIPTTDKLAIYLNDHLAGATVGVELSRRLARQNQDNEYSGVLERLASELAEDRGALLELMGRLAIGRDRLKLALAWSGEKAGRLKLNGSIVSYSPLSRLEELELLALGVQGKLAMWQALNALGDSHLGGTDLDGLITRARSQVRRLERLRHRAAEEAFAGLKEKIPTITSLNWGTNVSPEHHDKGFTHCFVLTFRAAKDRDAYLVDPAHKALGKVLGPVMDEVMVIDFWAQN